MYINYSTSSGAKTASTQISQMAGALHGVDLSPPTTGYNIVTIYDSNNSDTSGKTVLSELYCDAGTVGINHEYFSPVAVTKGLYAELTGTGTDARFFVRFSLG